MTRKPSAAQQRILEAARDLFALQGFELTTTKQIADRAGANEVTLFRNFGSKHDLLLATIEAAGIFARAPEALQVTAEEPVSLAEAVERYARDRLQTLSEFAELLRALVGAAEKFSPERRQAFGRDVVRGTQAVADYFNACAARDGIELPVSPEQFVGAIDSALMGYLLTESISESSGVWHDRDAVVACLTRIWLRGDRAVPEAIVADSHPPEATISSRESLKVPQEIRVEDLSAEEVRAILQQAKKLGAQHYAVAYLLFGTGLLPEEIPGLERSHQVCSPRQHLVRVESGTIRRQVPVNQWIMGKRYGSYSSNPLSQWLKGRKDDRAALFLNERGEPLTVAGVRAIWIEITAKVSSWQGDRPNIERARQTWCVEMLVKGMEPDALSILSGLAIAELQPFVRRAQEQVALEQAIRLDKPAK